VPDETKSGSSLDPMSVWRQWYDTAAKVWTNTVGGTKEPYMDPFGVYRQWLKSAGERRERGEAPTQPKLDPVKLWEEWFDTAAAMWRKSAESGPADPLGLTTQWLEMIEEARARMLSREGPPLDPLSFFREWYDRTSEMWSTMIGDTIGTEAFIESAGRFLESYTSYYKTLRQTSETQLHNLQIPTRSDVARVAGLVVALEDKVDRLDDAFEAFADERTQPAPQPAPREDVPALEARISRIESRLDTLIAAVEQLGANGRVAPEQEQPANGNEPSRRTPARRARRTAPGAAGESVS
jgi:polyhydroxyalkanoic acid synthase PhaR subunit